MKEAQDGAAAIRALDQSAGTFCLLLLDMTLPLVDGLAVLQHAASGDAPPTVLAMSASLDMLAEARAAGARETLAKPFGVAELLERVASCALHTPD